MKPQIIGVYGTATNIALGGLSGWVFRRSTSPVFSWVLIGYIVAIGFMQFLINILFNLSMKKITATVGSSLMIMAIPISLFWDWLLFAKVYTVFEVIGIVMIFGANLLLILYKSFKK